MKKLYQMAQGLALAGSLYAAVVGLTLATAGRSFAIGFPQCISLYDPYDIYVGCDINVDNCDNPPGQPLIINGHCANNADLPPTACTCQSVPFPPPGD